MSADTLDRDLAALDPAPAYSPADADRAERALALLLGAGVPKTRQPERGNRWRRWAVPATAAAAATALAVGIGHVATRESRTAPTAPAASTQTNRPAAAFTASERQWLMDVCGPGGPRRHGRRPSARPSDVRRAAPAGMGAGAGPGQGRRPGQVSAPGGGCVQDRCARLGADAGTSERCGPRAGRGRRAHRIGDE